MSNVLGAEWRGRIKHTALARFVAMGSIVCALAALIAILALVPAFISATIPLWANSGDTSVGESEQAVAQTANRTDAARIRSMLAVLAPFATDSPSVGELISRAYTLRPAGLLIETIKYQAGTPGQISITGISEAREPVNDFRTTLAKEEAFKGVSVPVAALVGALDGRFTITLTGTF